MGIRILAGTEPGSNFGHACFWDSSRDIAFGPVFYESGKPHHLDAGDIAEAFGKWVGWNALASMTVEEMKDKAHELNGLLYRDPTLAEAEGEKAGRLAVVNVLDSSIGDILLADDAAIGDELDEALDDEWGIISTDDEHPWVIVGAQEVAWMKGFAHGFKDVFADSRKKALAAREADDRQREADAAKRLGASGDPDGVLG